MGIIPNPKGPTDPSQDIPVIIAQINAYLDLFLSLLPFIVPTDLSGNGVTDDGPAIQAVLDANPGRTIWLPKPQIYYRITAALSPAQGQRIVGEGEGSEIRQVTPLANVITATSKTGVVLQNLIIYAVGDRSTLTDGAGILLSSCSECVVDGVTVTHHRGAGVVLNDSSDCLIENNLFVDAEVSGAVDNTDVEGDISLLRSSSRNIVANNRCISGQGFGVKVQSVSDGDSADDNIIAGNTVCNALIYGILAYRNSSVLPILQTVSRTIISNNLVDNVTGSLLNVTTGTYTFGTGIYIQGAEDSVVSNNNVNMTHSAAVSFSPLLSPGGIGSVNCSRGTYTGNNITNSGVNGMDLSDGNLFGDTLGGTTIDGNTILSTTEIGIRFRTRNHVVLTNNTISLTGGNGIEVNNITTVLVNDYVISGNLIKDATGSGIIANYIENAVINDNLIDTTSVHGISTANCVDISINGNTAKDYTVRGIHVTSTTVGAIVDGNTLVGTGTSVEGIRLDALTTIGTNRVTGNVNNWRGDYAVLRGTSNATAVGNVGAGEDNLMSFVIPAATMVSEGDNFHVSAWGQTANNANAKTLKMYFGSAVVMTVALAANQAGAWKVEADFARDGAPNSQRASVQLLEGGTVTQVDVERSTVTETEANAITIKFTATATADNDIVQLAMIVPAFNSPQ